MNLHPGAAVALRRLDMNELDVARAIAAGELTSPQPYQNMFLFALRITGTGVAYRPALKEFVYRKPSNYLTDDFLQRCNGLAVIMLHPDETLLNSEEFGERVVGSVLLPYIQGDEVWGVAKIYDTEAIELLCSDQMSTSPAVLIRTTENFKLELGDGKTLLVEGRPSLLDHIAIVPRGVWDKGDPENVGVKVDARADSVELPVKRSDVDKLQQVNRGMCLLNIQLDSFISRQKSLISRRG